MIKALVVVDMQNDFISGALGTKEAKNIVPSVMNLINDFKKETNQPVIFTQDTHGNDYMGTLEGQRLPVPHCIQNTDGWELNENIKRTVDDKDVCVKKETFGYTNLSNTILTVYGDTPDEIMVCGLCTDICIISNVMLLKAAFPNTVIKVKEDCCAGVTPESHNNALNAMKVCHIDIC